AFYKSLIILCNHGMVQPGVVFDLSFSLLDTNDKEIRLIIRGYIFKHLKFLKEKNTPNSKIRPLQQLIFNKLSEKTNIMDQRVALEVLCSLYRSKTFSDDRLANIIANACFSKDSKVAYKGVSFLLGKAVVAIDNDKELKEDDDLEAIQKRRTKISEFKNAISDAKHSLKFSKKTRSSVKKLEQIKKDYKKMINQDIAPQECDVSPLIGQIYDPFGFSEQLLKQLNSRFFNKSFKLMEAELLSRLISYHQ
ncbi:MAG: Protein SDA1, partial [Paramarteilia canceri]